MKTGDIILFKGNGALSAFITALPGAAYSHVGMYVDHPVRGPCVFESTSLGTIPDLITGRLMNGVQISNYLDRIGSYDGEVFVRPIIGERTESMLQGIFDFIDKYHGTPYEKDNLQLVRAELDMFPWQQNEPDPSSLFCSETVVMCLRAAGMIDAEGKPDNEFTPTDCSDGHMHLVDGLAFGEITRI